jgi:hypothetical protein
VFYFATKYFVEKEDFRLYKPPSIDFPLTVKTMKRKDDEMGTK